MAKFDKGVGNKSLNFIANLDDNEMAVYKRLKSNEFNDNNRFYTFLGRDIMSSKEYPNIIFISGIKDVYFTKNKDAEEYLQKYAKGGEVGDKNELDKEIFLSLLKIYKSEGNSGKDLFSFSEYKLGKILSQNAFDRIKSGKSPLGKFGLYGGGLGQYYALDIANGDFYKRISENYAKGSTIKGNSNYRKFGAENSRLAKFNIDDLDDFESMQYNQFSKSMDKASALQILINNVEGDYSQLNEQLSEIAEEQFPSDEFFEDNRQYKKGGAIKGFCYTIGGL